MMVEKLKSSTINLLQFIGLKKGLKKGLKIFSQDKKVVIVTSFFHCELMKFLKTSIYKN